MLHWYSTAGVLVSSVLLTKGNQDMVSTSLTSLPGNCQLQLLCRPPPLLCAEGPRQPQQWCTHGAVPRTGGRLDLPRLTLLHYLFIYYTCIIRYLFILIFMPGSKVVGRPLGSQQILRLWRCGIFSHLTRCWFVKKGYGVMLTCWTDVCLALSLADRQCSWLALLPVL